MDLISFSNETKQDKILLKQFVDFHWTHYKDDPQYVPLLDYEYLGFKLLGLVGFFEPRNLFFKHAEMRFFLAKNNGRTIGRCNAFVNHAHNEYWHDKVGFFGQFECLDDLTGATTLLAAAEEWLKSKGMESMRGPQNLPINEATPGCLTNGFQSRPVMYYHYNKPYYASLFKRAGFDAVKKIYSWEVRVQNPMEEKLARVAQRVIDRYNLSIEDWGDRPLNIRKQEMFEIYNDAWSDNWGFVPFTQEEFYHIVDEMMLVMEEKLFLFVYVNGEAAAFFGGVMNITEKLKPIPWCRRCEMLRAIKMLLTKNNCKGFRLGYLGVKKKFRRLGLDGVMLWKQKQFTQSIKLEYCDIGWVLEDNTLTRRLVELMGAEESKEYTVFERKIN
ncbi:hypothetical protein JXA70_03415 [candidate division KSB1 bacterium]|nr:hypothetical protein [candidate division KSB1 bacterium]